MLSVLQNMRPALLTLLAFTAIAEAEIPEVSKSLSPDGKIHAVMDVDRDNELVFIKELSTGGVFDVHLELFHFLFMESPRQ